MVRSCAVPGCLQTSRNSNSNLKRKFFRFPSDEQRCNYWVKQIGRMGLEEKGVKILHSSYFVCELHFADSDRTKRVLKKNAVPTLLLPQSEDSSGTSKYTQTGDAELFGSHSDDGPMDTIETSTKTKTSTNTKPTKRTKTQIAIPAVNISGDEGFSCNVCSGRAVGFRYTCVQCANYSFCAGCEARGEHSLHYVLRVPRDAKNAEVDAMLSKIRAQLLYGLETEEAEQETDDRVVPALPVEFEIKTEIKEELPDPLEHEDAFQPDDDHYTEPECIVRESTSKEKTLTPAPVNTSSMILAETEGNYVIIENPVRNIKTEPKTTKHKTTEPEHDKSEKRLKIYLEEQTRTTEALMDTSEDTAGPSTESASWEMPVIVKTEKKDEGAFQVFSHSSHRILKDKPGSYTCKLTILFISRATLDFTVKGFIW